MSQSYRLKISRPSLKLKVATRIPAQLVADSFLTITKANGVYTFNVDYTRLGAGPIQDPTTAMIALLDQTAGSYKEVSLASLLTSGLDADLQAIAALTTSGILARTASDTWVLRTVTGTANEIIVTNGDGVSGAPTISLPAALTFTGKTVTGGTYASAGTYNKVTITAPASAATLTLIDGTTLTGPASSGTVMTLGNNETVTGIKTFGGSGAVGKFKLAGTTSGTTIVDASATASGTITIPAATDTLVGKATTDILTNKTYDTAGAGNIFKINGTTINAITGTGSAVLATSPTLVTPLLGTPTSGVLTNCTGLPLAGLATQAAFTFVGNNTSGSAIPTAVDISALTAKASPLPSDLVMISDQAASGAWKKVTVSSLASAGSVASIAGNTGAFTLSTGITNSTNDIRLALNNTTLQASPTNPTGTASATGAMMGLGATCKLTPTYSGRIKIEFIGNVTDTISGQTTTIKVFFGTGAAPANAAAPTGTQVGNQLVNDTPSANFKLPFTNGGVITGLTPGTAYWFDLSLAVSSGTGSLVNLSCNAMEF